MAKKCVFVSRLSSEKVCVIWRINDFTADTRECGKSIESPQFWFSNANWTLKLYPKGRLKNESDTFVLFLKCSSPTETNNRLKVKFDFVNALGDSLLSREFSYKRKWDISLGVRNFLTRETLLKILSGFLSPNKTLTVKCEICFSQDKQSSDALTADISPFFSLSDKDSFMKNTFGTMFKSTSFSDVVIRVGRRKIAAHKIVLCNRSKVFKAMLENDMKEKRDNVINLEMPVRVAEEMLRYVYTENVNSLLFSQTLELYSAADRYDLQGLRDKCRHFMMESLSAGNVCEIIALADLHSDIDLGKKGREFFANNVRNVLKLEEWMSLEKLNPEFCLNLLRNTIVGNIII